MRASYAISLAVTWTVSCKSHKSNYILITECRLLFSEKGIWAINGKKCWMWVSFGNHHLQSLEGYAISLTPFNHVHFFFMLPTVQQTSCAEKFPPSCYICIIFSINSNSLNSETNKVIFTLVFLLQFYWLFLQWRSLIYNFSTSSW